MSDNVENAVFEILKKFQTDIPAVRADIQEFRTENRVEHEQIQLAIRKQRRDGAGMLVMTRAVVGDFEERVTDLEQRVGKLEDHDH
ncbi:MAG: hypothetical protein ABWY18_06725 [Tardiphaga sp.]